MSNATEGLWLKWAWQHYALVVDEFATYEDAIEAASLASDGGDESLSYIEGPMGVVDAQVVSADMDRASEERYAESRTGPPMTHAVKVASKIKSGESAWFDSYATQTEAESVAERLAAQIGAERVTIEALRVPA